MKADIQEALWGTFLDDFDVTKFKTGLQGVVQSLQKALSEQMIDITQVPQAESNLAFYGMILESLENLDYMNEESREKFLQDLQSLDLENIPGMSLDMLGKDALEAFEASKAELQKIVSLVQIFSSTTDELLAKTDELPRDWGEVASIISALLQDVTSMGDALGIMDDRGRDFFRSVINSVQAAGELLTRIQAINAAKAVGQTTSFLSKLGVVGAGLGVVTGLIGMVGSLFRGGRRNNRSSEEDRLSVSISRSLTEVQGNAMIMLGEQQVYWLRKIYGISDGPYSPSGATSRSMAPPVGGGHGKSAMASASKYNVSFDGVTIETPFNPDDPAFQLAAGQALTKHMRKHGVRLGNI
ncbi:MAG: hypothetical protein OXI24_16960 [Candidatus Poribacteria bacterium]|nr:hypothetical protein [Candidatus Poribacteria bacterium]